VALRDVLTALANNQTTWSTNHVAGYDMLSHSSVEFLEILPVADDPLSQPMELTASFQKFIVSRPDLEVGVNTYSVFPDQEAFFVGEAAFTAKAGSSGNGVVIPSRLVPREQFATPAKVDALVSSILDGMETVVQMIGPTLGAQVHFIVEKTAPVNTPDTAHLTSANPAWRDTLWHLVTAAAWGAGTPDSKTSQILTAARAALVPISDILSVQAAYTNEADPAEPNWQQVFYGDNFDRLVTIKQKYDPESVLNCWKCPGWLGPQDPMYSCDSDNPVPSVPA
jgi:hypothetical protein